MKGRVKSQGSSDHSVWMVVVPVWTRKYLANYVAALSGTSSALLVPQQEKCVCVYDGIYTYCHTYLDIYIYVYIRIIYISYFTVHIHIFVI